MQILSSHVPKGRLAYVGAPVLLAVWIGASEWKVVDPLLLPSPLRVLAAVYDIGPPLLLHTAATVSLVLAGYVGSLFLGAFVGIWMQYSRPTYAVLDGLIETWRPVPPVALV